MIKKIDTDTGNKEALLAVLVERTNELIKEANRAEKREVLATLKAIE